jgi:hypothetical protein
MTFIRKTLCAALSVAASFSSLAVADIGNDRIVCAEQLRNTVTEPFVPLDLNHAGMLGLGIFTQNDVDTMVTTAIEKFRDSYGINFDENTNPSVIVATGGIRVIPGLAQMIPYINNPPLQDYYVTIDTQHRNREGKWIQVSVGQLVVFTSTGTITTDPAAPNEGAKYKPNDNWFYGYNMFLKKDGIWSKPSHREIITSTSYQLGVTFPNQWNKTEIFVTLKSVDEDSNEGICLAPTAFLNIPEGSTGTSFADNLNYYIWKSTAE